MRASIIGLAVLFTVVFGVMAPASAAPIPGVFEGTNPGALCATVQIPSLGPLSILLQVNFDPFTNEGIDLATADRLFEQITDIVPLLNSLIGPDTTITCSFSPSQVQAQFGLDGFEMADFVSPSFESLGFSLYVILDAYNWVEPEFLGSAQTLRVDAYIVAGANDLQYLASVSVLRQLFP